MQVTQPFLENTIWQGLRQKKQEAMLEVEVQSFKKYLTIIIHNKGVGREAAGDLTGQQQKSFGMVISWECLKHSPGIR